MTSSPPTRRFFFSRPPTPDRSVDSPGSLVRYQSPERNALLRFAGKSDIRPSTPLSPSDDVRAISRRAGFELACLEDPDFRLLCSDETEITVNKAILCTQSSVFRGMFECTTQDPDDNCIITERREEFMLLLAAMEFCNDFELKELPILVQLGDKYGCQAGREMARLCLYKLSYDTGLLRSNPILFYAVACVIDDEVLKRRSAEAASESFSLPHVEKIADAPFLTGEQRFQLHAYFSRRRAIASRIIYDLYPPADASRCHGQVNKAWELAINDACQTVWRRDFFLAFRSGILERQQHCEICRKAVLVVLNVVENEFASEIKTIPL